MRHSVALAIIGAAALVTACSSRADLPRGTDAYQSFPPPRPGGELPPYRIGAFDKIAVTVFQEDDLSVRDVQVDSGGNILLPLIGQVSARGRTSTELAEAIAALLGRKYLEHPQVSVIVQDSVSQKVTVEGSVQEPGVYAIEGRTTLLDAIAMAKGTSRVAALDDAVVFREIGGQRMGAMFDIKQITQGKAEDPEILGNDTVVIGLSNVKAAWRDFLTAAPLIAAFRPFN